MSDPTNASSTQQPEEEKPKAPGDLKITHFGPAKIALVAFEQDGVQLPPKVIVADVTTDKFYCIAQMADQVELDESETTAIKKFIDALNASHNNLRIPVGPDGRPIMPPGMVLGPNGVILPQ